MTAPPPGGELAASGSLFAGWLYATAAWALCGLVLAGLAWEKALLRRARRRLRRVVQVNGTRGKSTVTRMVHAVLREAGYQAWGKTTGTEPRVLFPDGSEKKLRRLGPANVREQRDLLLRAARSGADALVVECNAVRPELQLVSSAYLAPDLTVLTNARPDHRAEQGDTAAAAAAFAATIPRGGAAASADPQWMDAWAAAAAGRGARFFRGDSAAAAALDDIPENAACALAVAEWLGLSKERAERAIRQYKPDPGAFGLLRWSEPAGAEIWFADALAANDPESTAWLAGLALNRATAAGMAKNAPALLVVALRADRPDRSLQFVDWAIGHCRPAPGTAPAREDGAAGRAPISFDTAVFLGPLPWSLRTRLQRSGLSWAAYPDGPARWQAGGWQAGGWQAGGWQAGGWRAGGWRAGGWLPSGGDCFVLAAGNRGGAGAALHAWATAKAAPGRGDATA